MTGVWRWLTWNFIRYEITAAAIVLIAALLMSVLLDWEIQMFLLGYFMLRTLANAIAYERTFSENLTLKYGPDR